MGDAGQARSGGRWAGWGGGAGQAGSGGRWAYWGGGAGQAGTASFLHTHTPGKEMLELTTEREWGEGVTGQ